MYTYLVYYQFHLPLPHKTQKNGKTILSLSDYSFPKMWTNFYTHTLVGTYKATDAFEAMLEMALGRSIVLTELVQLA